MSLNLSIAPEPIDPNSESVPKERILIVDDSAVVRKIYSDYLSARFECSVAGSFEEAISILRENVFAVVVTDVIMPGQSGIELLRKVIENYSPTEVIVASGVNRPQRALDAMRVGAFDYLIKPFSLDVLEITIDRAVAHRALFLSAARYKRELETRNIELAQRKEQLERLQAQIVQSEKMASLGQLAAGVAHELNNPAGFVHANLEILGGYIDKLIGPCDGAGSGEPSGHADPSSLLKDIHSIIADCREGSDRIRDIVQNLKTFSRLDEAEYKPTNIQEGIEATIRLLSNYFSSGPISVERDFGDLPLFNGFSSQLNQVWVNLLANAAQSIGSAKGIVSIRTWEETDDIFVEVRDTGAGIPVQNLSRIFDPFFTTKPVGEGTGLGLSISFGIVTRHGGNISVDTKLGKGTTFIVRLPKSFEPGPADDDRSITPYLAPKTTEVPYETQDTFSR